MANAVARAYTGDLLPVLTTARLKSNLRLNFFPPSGPNNSASYLFLTNYGASFYLNNFIHLER